MFAGPQVDEMRAAGAMKTDYVFEAPLVKLVRELAARRITRVALFHTGAEKRLRASDTAWTGKGITSSRTRGDFEAV